MRALSVPVLALAALLATAPAGAQMPNLGGLSGMLGGAGVPNIGATGMGNAAGLLGYCIKNQLLGATGTNGTAGSALSALTARPGVATSPGYAQGQAGTVVTGQGRQLSLGGLGDQIKGRICGMVLNHARSMIGGAAAQ